MAGIKDSQGQLVFGLDIGTRSIVGTVGYMAEGQFHVVAQRVREHETRAMLDGQIHDIGRVSQSIMKVKEALEEDCGRQLGEVCIAAAGRVLRTVTTHVETTYAETHEVSADDVYELSSLGIEQAYEELHVREAEDVRFYCVGYTAMRYFMNGYQISNPEGHQVKELGMDLIATFLPDDVVDGLYKSVEMAGLAVSNLTLEPIAAISVAIPEKFRMLNLALVDVGAGTSDISITKEGTITAYGMIPVAGDSLTDIIVQHCLVDFDTAEKIKRESGACETIEYADILGLPQSITAAEVQELLAPSVEQMTKQVADCIRELNGDKSVSAVFVVGGGGMIPGYTKQLAKELGIAPERVAIRGREVLQNVDFQVENPIVDSLMVTPIGICLSYYEQSNNFIFVDFNKKRVKLYDNGRLTVADAALQADFSNQDLFPKRGQALTFTVNEKTRMVRGEQGETAIILVNGAEADLYTQVRNGDCIEIVASTAGREASVELRDLPEMKEQLHVVVNDAPISMPKMALVNGQIQNEYYRICEGDDIQIRQCLRVEEIAHMMDLTPAGEILVNNVPAQPDTEIYENFTIRWELSSTTSTLPDNGEEHSHQEQSSDDTEGLTVMVNGSPILLKGKDSYVFVDIFSFIDFDLNASAGRNIITLLNGRKAEYMEPLNEGDVLEIYWETK